jgi:hypothetical protein
MSVYTIDNVLTSLGLLQREICMPISSSCYIDLSFNRNLCYRYANTINTVLDQTKNTRPRRAAVRLLPEK